MRKFIFMFWKMIDPIYFFFTRLTYIHRGENIFRVRLTRYKGQRVTLSDGTEIKKNDLLIKIHFHNVKLLSEIHRFRNDFQKGNYFYHSIKASLPELAVYVSHHPKREEIKGLIGITTLHLEKNSLGFEIVNIRSRLYRKIKQLTLFPIYFLSSEIYRKKEKKSIEPIYYFMSKSVLMEKYLPPKELSSVHFEEVLPF